jgi:hypothetical protein
LRRIAPVFAAFLTALIATLLGALILGAPARAVEAVRVTLDAPAIDLTPMIERYRSDGDLIQISTAPGKDGIVRRIVVKARDTGARPDWMVFALTNDTDEQVDRVLVAPHFRLVGSGVIWPDLGGSRIAAITASQGSSLPSIPVPPSLTWRSCAAPTSRRSTSGTRKPTARSRPG